jgi:hypothetical protein
MEAIAGATLDVLRANCANLRLDLSRVVDDAVAQQRLTDPHHLVGR